MTVNMNKGASVTARQIKVCDICLHVEHRYPALIAFYDVKTTDGRWGNLCGLHFDQYSMYPVERLGTGKGQQLVYPDGLVEDYLAEEKRISDLADTVLEKARAAMEAEGV